LPLDVAVVPMLMNAKAKRGSSMPDLSSASTTNEPLKAWLDRTGMCG
jgi:hypothetical protein